MTKSLITLAFVLAVFVGKAQKTKGNDTTIYNSVDQAPEFPGGEVAFSKFLGKNLHYFACPNQSVTGKIIFQFVIEKDGSISNIKCKTPSCPESNAEIKRVMSLSPKWMPGKMHSKPVRVGYFIPMEILLQQEDQ